MLLDSGSLNRALVNTSSSLRDCVAEQVNHHDFSGRIDLSSTAPAIDYHGLLSLAKTFAEVPLSGFRVGAVALGTSGQLYLGANMEFVGVPIGTSLHAEQSAVINAWIHGEKALHEIIVSEAPCGHCRQFLHELSMIETLHVTFGNYRMLLSDLLPASFGSSRKIGHGLLDGQAVQLESTRSHLTRIETQALDAARNSYAPYTLSHEGIAIECTDGRTFTGRVAQSAAFNPTVPAVVVALNQRNLSASRRLPISHCAHARLATSLSSQSDLTTALLRNIGSIHVQTVFLEPE